MQNTAPLLSTFTPSSTHNTSASQTLACAESDNISALEVLFTGSNGLAITLSSKGSNFMPKFGVCLPRKQKAHKNESALLYQYANRECKDASTLCRKRFNVLDGPPYANGGIHIGHIMNKLLKQITTLAQTQIGRRSALKTN